MEYQIFVEYEPQIGFVATRLVGRIVLPRVTPNMKLSKTFVLLWKNDWHAARFCTCKSGAHNLAKNLIRGKL